MELLFQTIEEKDSIMMNNNIKIYDYLNSNGVKCIVNYNEIIKKVSSVPEEIRNILNLVIKYKNNLRSQQCINNSIIDENLEFIYQTFIYSQLENNKKKQKFYDLIILISQLSNKITTILKNSENITLDLTKKIITSNRLYNELFLIESLSFLTDSFPF